MSVARYIRTAFDPDRLSNNKLEAVGCLALVMPTIRRQEVILDAIISLPIVRGSACSQWRHMVNAICSNSNHREIKRRLVKRKQKKMKTSKIIRRHSFCSIGLICRHESKKTYSLSFHDYLRHKPYCVFHYQAVELRRWRP